MKVIVRHKYGSPDDALKPRDIDKSVVNDDAVLVLVRATALHTGDWLTGTGCMLRALVLSPFLRQRLHPFIFGGK